jgi:hypothetical protein
MLTTASRRPHPALLLLLPLLLGCPSAEPEEQGPCPDIWGGADWIHVDASAPEGGDGSVTAPFATLDDALAEARATGTRNIGLGPGDYAGRYTLSEEQEGWRDSGLEIAGCGRDGTRIAGIVAEEVVGADVTVEVLQPVFDVSGASTADVTVRDLAIDGGRRALRVRGGAGAAGPIVLRRLDVVDSLRLAVLVDGATSVAELDDVLVDGVEPEDEAFGWGIAIQTAMYFSGDIPAPTALRGVEVTGASGVGILADGAWVEFVDVQVLGVASQDGALGRGVQLQRWTAGELDGLVSSGNSDAALFLESPGRGTEPVVLTGCTFGPTGEADAGAGESAADGLVASQFFETEPFSPEDFLVVIDASELEGNARAHLLAEAVTLEIGPDNIFGKGTDFPVVAQGDAIVQGIGGGEPGHPAEELGPGDALQLNRTPMVLDELTEQ